ncbi:hypothetical protein KA977_15815 [Candidatus Dependentiae bacterium]|nr:hypothetical protein [Candidatus Dependentiae bacterium]
MTKKQMKDEIVKQLKNFTVVTIMYNNDFDNTNLYNYYFYIQIIPISINLYEILFGSNSSFGNFNLLKELNYCNIKLNEKEIIKLINKYDFNFVQFEYSEDIYYQFRLENEFFIEI